MALFSVAYWPPVSYYRLAAKAPIVSIEQYEFYQKQSYRNRCIILSANGPISLIVPILRPHHSIIKDIRIDYSKPWQQMHWRSIESAYRSSAFFEEFGGEIREVYKREVTFLFDWNLKLWALSLSLLDLRISWAVTELFIPISKMAEDYRFLIHPKEKRKPEGLAFEPYYQVFAHKFGFFPDLSILDLIFNEGALKPESHT